MPSRRWFYADGAWADWQRCREVLGAVADQAAAELLVHLESIASRRAVPTDVLTRGAVLSEGVHVWPTATLWVFHANANGRGHVALHFMLTQPPEAGTGDEGDGGRPPPPPDAAWDLAQDRLDDSGW